MDEALAIAKYLGYVPEQYAEILGVPAGTQYYALANASTGGSRSSGGSTSSGASTLAKKFASMGSAQILAYIKKNFGEGVLADSDWALLTEAGIDPDWLRKNGFRTEAQQTRFQQLAAYLTEARMAGVSDAEMEQTIRNYLKNGWVTAEEATRLRRQSAETVPQAI